jgi:arabinogalactan oligomer/maltooligosaccharide transport system permease protein
MLLIKNRKTVKSGLLADIKVENDAFNKYISDSFKNKKQLRFIVSYSNRKFVANSLIIFKNLFLKKEIDDSYLSKYITIKLVIIMMHDRKSSAFIAEHLLLNKKMDSRKLSNLIHIKDLSTSQGAFDTSLLSIISSILSLEENDQICKAFSAILTYSIIRLRMFEFNSSRTLDNFITKESYSNHSHKQSVLINTITSELDAEIFNRREIISLATDTVKKPWLKDDPKLNSLQKSGLGIKYLILSFWAFIVIYPIYLLISSSLNQSAKTSLTPISYDFGFQNFSYLFNETLFFTWLLNTLIVSFSTMVIVVSFTCFMAYAYSRYRFRGKKSTLVGIIILQMFPTITALPVFLAYYVILKQNSGLSPLIVLILIYSGGGIFSNTFVLKGYMDGISTEIDDASKIDGCSTLKTFTKIILPLTKPMLSVVALWSFIGPFGDFILPSLLLNTDSERTVAVGIRTLITPSGQDNSKVNYGAYTAASLLISIPIVLLFMYLQKFIRGGRTAGGVK